MLAGLSGPNITVAHIHPATLVLLLAVVPAFWLVYRVREKPMWNPEQTKETVQDVPEPGAQAHQTKSGRTKAEAP